ncbi:electron transfer flavoprotein subunit alpha/FixB family protein [bacterium]|nr:electron transfer flavoprotein subunit alpha/FixB family protein [bacterium]
MSVLIYANTANGKIHKSAFEAVAYGSKIAADLGTNATAIVIGACSDAESLGEYGATKILHANDSKFNDFDPSIYTQAVVKGAEAEGADVIIFSHDFSGKSIAPRVAAKLDAGLVSGAVDYPSTANGFTVKKAVFSGKAFANITINTDKKVISLLPNSVDKSAKGGSASVETFSPEVGAATVKVKEVIKESADLPLTEAEKVVSAGRGLKGPENWGMIEDLAKELGAATACSRPVADMDWRPHHEHVGQTGVAIRPNLYIAVGISGAIQHLAGVNQSKTIVVINNDPEAPFFKSANYGIVGDAFEVIPKLVEAAKAFNASNH